jgi:hypothetical protein
MPFPSTKILADLKSGRPRGGAVAIVGSFARFRYWPPAMIQNVGYMTIISDISYHWEEAIGSALRGSPTGGRPDTQAQNPAAFPDRR